MAGSGNTTAEEPGILGNVMPFLKSKKKTKQKRNGFEPSTGEASEH